MTIELMIALSFVVGAISGAGGAYLGMRSAMRSFEKRTKG